MDEVGHHKLDPKAGDDASQQNCGFRDRWADEIESGGEDDHVKDVVDETSQASDRILTSLAPCSSPSTYQITKTLYIL